MQTVQKIKGISGFSDFMTLTLHPQHKNSKGKINIEMDGIVSVIETCGAVKIYTVDGRSWYVQEPIEQIKAILAQSCIQPRFNFAEDNSHEYHTALETIKTLQEDNANLRKRIERYNESERKYAEENRKLESRLNGVLRQAKIKKDQIRSIIEKDGELFAAVLPLVQMYREKLSTVYGVKVPKGITNKNYIERLPKSPYTSIKVPGVMKDLESAVNHWHKCGFGRMTKGIGLPAPNAVQMSRETVDEIASDFLDMVNLGVAKVEGLCKPMMELVEKNVTDDPEAQIHIAAGFLTLAQQCPEELQNFLDQLK